MAAKAAQIHSVSIDFIARSAHKKGLFPKDTDPCALRCTDLAPWARSRLQRTDSIATPAPGDGLATGLPY
jgi:hypothetical protein